MYYVKLKTPYDYDLQRFIGMLSEHDGITYGPEQMPDVSGFPYVTQELLNRGYSTGDIRKILGENFIRVLNEAEK